MLEHVIGFHDVLLLRPLGLKPDRPRDDPRRRWELTLDRVCEAVGRDGLFARIVEVPAIGNSGPTRLDAAKLIPRLSQDVLIHSWDLARAVGADDRLDPVWCEMFFDQLPSDHHALSSSGMFAAPVVLGHQADKQSMLLARLGRDPGWRSPE
ncbi:hypothetical protein [Mycolicibacterium sp. CBMA 295]|uniref:hypothetical protein n=1 Tax=Mycolicibacterium sp. CBMA 295 TaxID=2606605 RepID=UPI002814E3A7|nr:hypothetical protein [Mycolicibacterium sp. CBMA 295]